MKRKLRLTDWAIRGMADWCEGTMGKREPKLQGDDHEGWQAAEDAYAAGARSAALDEHMREKRATTTWPRPARAFCMA